MKAIVVVPTIREECIKQFLERWENEFRDHEVIVVEDHPTREFSIKGENVTHYCHEDIERDLGEDAWIIPRGTDCVRSYGIWKAWQRQTDMIVTMDDDCYPSSPYPDLFLAAHWHRLTLTASSLAWRSTIDGAKARGEPYFSRMRQWPVALNHGLWEGVRDLDAVTQLAIQGGDFNAWIEMEPVDEVMPLGQFFPMCGMNIAFKPEIAPLMYFGLQGPSWPYDRFGDIWCGIVAKKVLDHLGLGATSGKPYVKHEQASSVWVNLRKEQPGYEFNETFWRRIDDMVLTGSTPIEAYLEIAHHLGENAGELPYLYTLGEAMEIWAGLFEEGD